MSNDYIRLMDIFLFVVVVLNKKKTIFIGNIWNWNNWTVLIMTFTAWEQWLDKDIYGF